MLDGHHLVENRARYGGGLALQLLGHRRHVAQATPSTTSGGWQHDTLTEDLDLSYRAQMAGWKFVYREDVVTPAELPEDVSAFRAQQFRWAKGTVQTARKLMKRVMTSRAHARAARRGVLPHDAALRVPAHGAAQRAAPPGAHPHAGDEHAARCSSSTSRSASARRARSLAFYAMAEAAQGRRRIDALKTLPGAPRARRGPRAAPLEGRLRRPPLDGRRVRPHAEARRDPHATATARAPTSRRSRSCSALVSFGERRRLARDGPLVRDAVRDALHDRLRLRRHARRRASSCARAPRRAASPARRPRRASSRACRRRPRSRPPRSSRPEEARTPRKRRVRIARSRARARRARHFPLAGVL